MKKVLGIFSSVLSVILMILIIKSYVGINTTVSTLENGVWSNDGLYKPENEGKIVTILFNFNSLENAYDSDMDIHFKTPIVKRHVEIFEEVPTQADGIWEWRWREIYDSENGQLGQKLFVGKVKGDILQFDSEIEKMLPRGDEIYIDDLTDESKASIEKKIGVRVGIIRTYFSDASSAAFSGELISHSIINPLFHDEGKIRIWYEKAYDDNAVFAITGIQKGKTLQKADNLDMSAVNEKVHSNEELISKVKKDTILSTSFFLVGDLVLIYFSLYWLGIIKKFPFIKKKTGTKESQTPQ